MKASYLPFFLIAVVLIFSGCASKQPAVTLEAAKGEQTINIKASDFKFEPNNIKAYKGDTVVLRIENISKKAHNFTFKDPKGNTVQNLDLPPGQTVTLKADLPESGVYEFYCDKPFHSTFGMKGQIEVVTK